ncbi:MAG: polysaccharide deacetylase family protein [Prevotellaceae bacterium]|jgi:peptidoglycan/xylan/chitin deacetylase (PgdA/CDA1 family)|nr:polysaccharide deacetylase family protein [Prevotellaceae bacterium]
MQFPACLRFIFGKDLLWRKPSEAKSVYLTFDDGPVPHITAQVLALLAAEGVRATFFCVGQNVEKYPELFAEIKRQGHSVGNHTFNHLKGFRTRTENYLENIKKADKLIQSPLFRPPHGQITWRQIRAVRQNFRIIMWDIITCDYDRTLSPAAVLSNVKKYSRNGSIVVFHDSMKAQKNVLAALPAAIRFWKTEGYEFKVL